MNPAISISIEPATQCPPRTVQDVLDDLREHNEKLRRSAVKHYTHEEFSFVQKMKGGTPHEHAVKELTTI